MNITKQDAYKLLVELSNKGINTEKMKAFLKQYINEEKIRASDKDFGLTTVSLSDLKPHELMKEDIPDGQLFNFIMASATLPMFRQASINDNVYLDGAFYNNCPYNLLINKGYDEVIIIRTKALGIFRKPGDSKIKCISPNDDLGSILLFSPENSQAQLKLGYHDGLRFAQSLLGRKYYVRRSNDYDFSGRLMSLDDESILRVGEILKLSQMPAKRMLFEEIIPILGSYLKLNKNFDYADFAVALLEYAAMEKNIERFCIYDYTQFCNVVKTSPDIRKWQNPLSSNKEKAVKLLGKLISFPF